MVVFSASESCRMFVVLRFLVLAKSECNLRKGTYCLPAIRLLRDGCYSQFLNVGE